MTRKFYVVIAILWAMVMGLTSCTDNECNEFKSNETEQNVSLKACLEKFQNSTSETRAFTQGIQITNIEKKTYSYSEDGHVTESAVGTTRSNTDQNEFTVLNITFRQDDSMGYAFMTEDNQKIYFFTDEGLISDTTNIVPLKSYINSIPEIVASERIADTNYTPNANLDTYETILPIVRFAWDQGYPFNYYAPYCGGPNCQVNNLRGRQPIGCVSIAVAQVIATVGSFHNQDKYNFKEFPIAAEKVENNQQAEVVGRFLKEIAVGCKVNFCCKDADPNSNGSTSDGDRAKAYLLFEKYQCDLVANKQIDPKRLEQNLKRGYPHIRGGLYNDPAQGLSGHMWVVDGMKIKSGGGNYYYHCNWGWGRASNGWIYDNPYTTLPEDGSKAFNLRPQDIYIDLVAIKSETNI